MLKSTSHMKDLTIHASDGEIGKVHEFYFDDETWVIRYLVVQTGDWIEERLVLISPVFLREADWGTKRLHVALTRKQVENSPKIDTHKPVSRQHEAEYMDYYGAGYYWGGPNVWGSGIIPADLAALAVPIGTLPAATQEASADSHLRSTNEVMGYGIEAVDGDLGHVKDFIVDPDTWNIRYLEVSTRDWWPGKEVLISPEWIDSVSWADSSVRIGLPRESIKNAPEYLDEKPMTHEYENDLRDYYNRLPNWIRKRGHEHASGL